MNASLQWNTVTLNIMPEFRPNKKMLEMYKDDDENDVQVYARCVRDAIAK